MPLVITRALFLALAVHVTALGVDLPERCRVRNPANYCTWASLESLGRLHGVSPLRGLIALRQQRNGGAFSDGGDMPKVIQQLNELGVRHIAEADGTYNRRLLAERAEKYGVVVTIIAGNGHANYVATDGRTYSGCHSIVLTHFDDSIVEFYDTSKPLDPQGQPKTWRAGRDWFDRYWSGNAIVILP